MSKRAKTLEELIPYYRGVYFATGVLKRRLGRKGPQFREAVKDISAYQAMVARYLEALQETQAMHRKSDEESP